MAESSELRVSLGEIAHKPDQTEIEPTELRRKVTERASRRRQNFMPWVAGVCLVTVGALLFRRNKWKLF